MTFSDEILAAILRLENGRAKLRAMGEECAVSEEKVVIMAFKNPNRKEPIKFYHDGKAYVVTINSDRDRINLHIERFGSIDEALTPKSEPRPDARIRRAPIGLRDDQREPDLEPRTPRDDTLPQILHNIMGSYFEDEDSGSPDWVELAQKFRAVAASKETVRSMLTAHNLSLLKIIAMNAAKHKGRDWLGHVMNATQQLVKAIDCMPPDELEPKTDPLD